MTKDSRYRAQSGLLPEWDAGIPRKITPHWLRRFFASAGLSKGVPVTDMAEWLGHRDPKITYQTYAHVMPDAPERLRALMDSVFARETELQIPLEFEASSAS
ncbi:tyrosine-type recombinase/integrase [Streptomyces sp. NBC_00234]|uniref:tyrosine-type recombinase/integrase n=1 Tax=Streptomyces sp. NBC_00234 TaxID=2903638 RepID=UPI003FA7E7D2